MTTLLPPSTSPLRRAAGAVLRSPVGTLASALVGPHGLDRYLELVDPLLARDVNRAIVTGLRRESRGTTTMTLRPARPVAHRAGQFVELTVEIDGTRYTRCYSISSSEHRGDGQFTLTVKADPNGRVSPHLVEVIGRGTIVEVSESLGDFVLDQDVPNVERLLLVSAGSGITAVMSILRTLVDSDAGTHITFLHYARTRADLAFADELALIGQRANVDVTIVLTQDPSGTAHGLTGHLAAGHVAATIGDVVGVPTYVCGPSSLLDAATTMWTELGMLGDLHVERFQLAPMAQPDPDHVGGTLTFADSRREVVATATTILAQAEAAGLTPKAGCRMGICHTCIRPKLAGQVRDVRDGRLSSCGPQEIQICISAPVGDVTIDL
ncbi:MAG: ferredoxin-NADP reductase [Glaciecola sp.]|jgi:ferredoxin-NADP reductase